MSTLFNITNTTKRLIPSAHFWWTNTVKPRRMLRSDNKLVQQPRKLLLLIEAHTEISSPCIKYRRASIGLSRTMKCNLEEDLRVLVPKRKTAEFPFQGKSRCWQHLIRNHKVRKLKKYVSECRLVSTKCLQCYKPEEDAAA